MRCIALLSSLAIASVSNSAPVEVSFLVTGTSGNYTLDFQVTNNVQEDHSVYFFGVELADRDIVGTPANWDSDLWTTWDNAPYGGTSTIYNNNWIHPTNGDLPFGQSKGGFKAHVATPNVPSNVKWFAYTIGYGDYLGSDNFNNQYNPGFEGVANPVPEPGTLTALGLGVAAVRRRKKA